MRPVYEKTGETSRNGEIEWCRVASWDVVGVAASMDDARRKFPPGYSAKCYSWVLEPIKIH